MSDITSFIKQHRLDAMRLMGQCVGAGRERHIEVLNPYSGQRIGTVPKATLEEIRQAYEWAHAYRPTLTRYERAGILNRCAALARERVDDIARLITAESGLSINDALYEAGRVSDVLLFGAQEVLKDDGQIFSCDLTHHGKQRRVYTQRSPLLGVITAITPFNHPMNQVAHKVIPSVATNNRMVLKP
jgi:acyl-CoA reductase-like NAD-dependent aldehyde dehydrogenase